MFYSNTLISIANSVAEDPRGQRKSAPVTEYLYVDIPASLIEQTQIVANPVDGMPREIRYATLRVYQNTVIKQTDQVLDQRTGNVFVVESVVQSTGALPMDIGKRVMLRRVGVA